ncbi:MAG: 3-dehydroquinate synthase [Coriobacteriia bacterium]|nr:3-dehydroquinate synthase [Coriobacteriia bacterium]
MDAVEELGAVLIDSAAGSRALGSPDERDRVGERGERLIRVEASGSYDVAVGRGLLDEVGARVRAALPAADAAVLVVSDEHVAPHYAARVETSLRSAGFAPTTLVLPAGEPTKCLANLGRVLEAAAEAGLTRQSTIVALGGGVIGDLAGFAAATYMRGCHLVQVATSLLAMVDSSVGGKTAIDLPQGKNLAGAFYQPSLVLCDLDVLATLPPEFWADGTGEIVKYGIMCDPELFEWLNAPLAPQVERVVARCVAIKRDVVEADEREGGLRKLLNLGHTVGHAIERLSGFGVSHGRAVAAGCAIMARACAAKGLCSADVAARVEAQLRVHGLPTGCDYAPHDLYEAALSDKKRVGSTMDVITVRDVGHTEVRRLDLPAFEALVAAGVSGSSGEPGRTMTADL